MDGWVVVDDYDNDKPTNEPAGKVDGVKLVGKRFIDWKPKLPEIDSREIFWRPATDPLTQKPMEHSWFVAQEYRMGSAGLYWRKLKGGLLIDHSF
jgi:hypothetical protein